jgi:hypothetical protein
MKGESRLTVAELLSLDAIIAAAQQRGLSFADRLDNTQEQAEAQAERVEAMWEARHGGLTFSARDREILSRIRDLTRELEFSPTLGQLIELRAELVRELSRQRG